MNTIRERLEHLHLMGMLENVGQLKDFILDELEALASEVEATKRSLASGLDEIERIKTPTELMEIAEERGRNIGLVDAATLIRNRAAAFK